jgi:hypothetical protein
MVFVVDSLDRMSSFSCLELAAPYVSLLQRRDSEWRCWLYWASWSVSFTCEPDEGLLCGVAAGATFLIL